MESIVQDNDTELLNSLTSVKTGGLLAATALKSVALTGHLLALFVIIYRCLGYQVGVPSSQHRSMIGPGTSESLVG